MILRPGSMLSRPAAGVSYSPWAANTSYILGDRMLESGKVFECVRAGKSEVASQKPAFSGVGAVGVVIVDGRGVNLVNQWSLTGLDPSNYKFLEAAGENAPGMVAAWSPTISSWKWSTDYGVNWASKSNAAITGLNMGTMGLLIYSPTLMLLCVGSLGTSWRYAKIARSVNGGTNWSVVYTKDAGTGQGSIIGKPFTTDGTNFYAILFYTVGGASQALRLLHSADSGATWHEEKTLTLTPNASIGGLPWTIAKITGSPNYWFVWAYGAQTNAATPGACRLSEDFNTENDGWLRLADYRAPMFSDYGSQSALSEAGLGRTNDALEKTSDGGANWSSINVGGQAASKVSGILRAWSDNLCLCWAHDGASGTGYYLYRSIDKFVNLLESAQVPSGFNAYGTGTERPGFVYLGDGVFNLNIYNTTLSAWKNYAYSCLKWQRVA